MYNAGMVSRKVAKVQRRYAGMISRKGAKAFSVIGYQLSNLVLAANVEMGIPCRYVAHISSCLPTINDH
jgi:hypothetical protein